MANKTITLPSGATVVVRDPLTVKQGDRRKVFSKVKQDDVSFDTTMEVSYAVIGIMVESWTLDLLPPSVKPEILDELSLPDFDVLQEEATEFMKALFPNLAKTEESDSDPKATTGESSV